MPNKPRDVAAAAVHPKEGYPEQLRLYKKGLENKKEPFTRQSPTLITNCPTL